MLSHAHPHEKKAQLCMQMKQKSAHLKETTKCLKYHITLKGALARKTMTTISLVDLVDNNLFSRDPKMRNYNFNFYLSYGGLSVLP